MSFRCIFSKILKAIPGKVCKTISLFASFGLQGHYFINEADQGVSNPGFSL